MHTEARKVRYPLHITISTLFIGLILIVGLVLSWLNYSKTSEIILSSADRVYDQLSQDLILDFTAIYKPVGETLRLLALSPVVSAASLEQRLESLGTLSAALENEPSVAAIQVGYENGDYFVVRQVASDYMHGKFDAPDGSVLMMDHIETGPDSGRLLVRLFFDGQLQQLRRLPSSTARYDPRRRPW